jgi:hypothetical protein
VTDSVEAGSGSRWLRALAVVVVTLPAALLTWLGSSLSKDPSDFVRNYGFLLPCSVIALPTLLALTVDEGVRSFNPRATGTAFGCALAVSAGTSLLGFLGIMLLVVD